MSMRAACTIALTLASLTFASTSASAQYYGAISFSPSWGAMGWAFDYRTREQARAAAIANCRKYVDDCQVVIVFKDGCGALAAGDRSYAAARSESKDDAQRYALDDCRLGGPNCRVLRWVCTSNSDF